MQNEISSGTMLGIVLIALAAVIGLGFGVFSIAKGVSNEGVVNVQDNLSTVSDSSFDDYDNKIVTGTQVIAAYKNFQGKYVAILVNTQAMTKGVLNNKGHKAYAFDIGGYKYVNYNALLSPNAVGTLSSAGENDGTSAPVAITKGFTYTSPDGLKFVEPNVETKNGFALDGEGKVIYDSNVGGFSKAGNCEYISSSAKFETRLIKDASGQNVGVAFKQLAK